MNRFYVSKIMFIKNNITKNIDTICGKIKTFIALMRVTMSKKKTMNESVGEFMIVIWY